MSYEPARRRLALNMATEAIKTNLENVVSLRALFLKETNFQIRYNACHERGWTDSYLLKIDGVEAGYGSIKGQEIMGRDTIFEFYVIPPFRKVASPLFRNLIAASGARYIECQSNDVSLSSMLFEFSREIKADVVLFEDHAVTEHNVPGAVVRPKRDGDWIFEHTVVPVGDYELAVEGEIVATAGFMLHYNVPFADLYMEVRKDCWGRGYGSFLLQEVKRACYLAGRVPAARCDLRNNASRATLIKAGLRVCGFMLLGSVNSQPRTASDGPP